MLTRAPHTEKSGLLNAENRVSLFKNSSMNFRNLFFCFSIFLVGCGPPTPSTQSLKHPNQASNRADSVANALRWRDTQDSLWLKNLEAVAFKKIYTFRSSETAWFKCDSFHFEKGNLVHPDLTHLLVYLRNRDGHFGEYSVWELKGHYWAELLHVDSGNSSQVVLFKDVNGDDYKDFLMEYYATAGSGEKNHNEVYLYNPGSHSFDYVDGLGMNPHFYPEKGIVTYNYDPTSDLLNWEKLELLGEVEVPVRGMIYFANTN